ncbi:MAG: 6,7-dimethyl-8-ribityllumazine synthase [Armatimonadetes bacterium]|nr:6,7-dimethyl-8-ribityllumazine synthase [Armatimonadota bacterium]
MAQRGATFRGGDDAAGLAFALVVSRYNEAITQRLLDGALEVLAAKGAVRTDVAWVPGALEIPLVARRMAEARGEGATGRRGARLYDAVICLGCVIKGETLHFDLVAQQAAAGIARVSLETGVPVINEVLAVFEPEQAAARSGGRVNLGADAAHAAIQMANLIRALEAAEK